MLNYGECWQTVEVQFFPEPEREYYIVSTTDQHRYTIVGGIQTSCLKKDIPTAIIYGFYKRIKAPPNVLTVS